MTPICIKIVEKGSRKASFFMHRGANGKLLLKQHAPRAASRGEERSPTGLPMAHMENLYKITCGGCVTGRKLCEADRTQGRR